MFKKLIEEADSLTNESKPDLALEAVRRAQAELKQVNDPDLMHRVEIAGLLIDIGEQLWNEEITQEGLTVLVEEYSELKNIIVLASLEYNIGNAKEVLYNISRKKNKQRFSPESISLLSEAKDHYWRALKADAPEQMRRELCVNLANSLDSAGRLVESLFWYDQALSVDPTFGMAQCNRGIALMFLDKLSDTHTISLIDEARKSFKFALGDPNLFPHLVDMASKRIHEIDSKFLELGWTDERIAKDNKQHDEEYEQHDDYWKFCLANHLALSEHSLYCKCAGARRDDLSIVKQSGSIAGDFVPRLELLLNRLKSEFCYARALYYQSLRPETKWPTDSFQGTYTEQYEGEAIGIEEEFLRNSFRLCFGILDRIAQGLNELFSFAEPEEHLYFESFWRKNGKSGNDRWNLINNQDNKSLVALFSLATDLNKQKGEWGFFKTYRNLMEHGLLVLLENGYAELPSHISPQRIQCEAVPISEFKEHTMQMLQFTRSAIFSFAYCVRLEGVKKLKKDKPGKVIRLQLEKKSVGKE
ncbi:MAG: hypothetical protein GQ565_12600 [Candidatus Aegiribacteria sp.]|nr:hypothetical protein [Candidatus Aegiribacteria sp.]